MQTITTKYLGATNNGRGARIKATTSSGVSKTISYPYELSGAACHIKAVKELNKSFKFPWVGEYIYDSSDTGYIFMYMNDKQVIYLYDEDNENILYEID